jgi:hypothetical protein
MYLRYRHLHGLGQIPKLAVRTTQGVATAGAQVVQAHAGVAGEADGGPHLVGSNDYGLLSGWGLYSRQHAPGQGEPNGLQKVLAE